MPAFETGRLAGLGDVDGIRRPSTRRRRPGPPAPPSELPYYYDWYFRTGENEDFESLVKRLEPRPVDKRVGIRDLDAIAPRLRRRRPAPTSASIPPPDPADPPPPQTVLGLEGALRAPTRRSRPATVDATKPFFADLAEVLNFADDRVAGEPRHRSIRWSRRRSTAASTR